MIFGALILLAIGVMGFVITRSLRKQIGGEPNDVLEIANSIANGDLNRSISLENGDTSSLMASMKVMQQTLKSVIDEQTAMSAENKAGNLKAAINSGQFKGSYKTMAENINLMAVNQADVLRKTAQCITEFANGDFDAPLERFTGQRIFINEGVEQLRSNFKDVLADMQHMSDEHDAGDVDVVIDEAKYKGAYAQMVHGVNSMVCGHVAEKNQMIELMRMLGDGDFEVQIQQYPGKKAEINKTLDRLK